ncbi:hypothetical protein [Singulisphaera sp. PoT]|uniref:hypothetical protein n=1 Tax=Singulisphaera sp. PoT TaxID=3411797 RepID=UPI003BF55ED7
MAVTEDIARLVFETAGTEAIDDLKENLAYTKLGLQQLQSAYQAGNVSTADYFATTKKLTASIAEMQGHLDGLEQAQRDVAQAMARSKMTEEEYLGSIIKTDAALAKKTATADKTAKSQSNLRQSIQAGSYAFQDFTSTSGDLGAKLNSITNNLPQLLVGLGGLGQVVSIGATVAIALYRNWDQVTRLFESKNPFPAAAKSVKEMKDEVEHAKDQMKALETNTSLTKGELEKYTELRKTIADTEAKITQEEEKQANLKKFKEIKGTAQVEDSKWIKDGLADLGGDKEGLATAVAKSLHQRAINQEDSAYVRALEEANNTEGEDRKFWAAQMKGSKKELDRLKGPEGLEEFKTMGIEAVTKAMTEGDLGAYNQLQTAVGQAPDLFTKEQQNYIRDASPETKKRVEKEEREEAAEQEKSKNKHEAEQITREASKKRQAKEADKIRDEIDSMAKGGDFTKSNSDLIDKIKKSGGMLEVAGKPRETKTAEQQYDVLKDLIRAQVEEKLKEKGFDLKGQEKLLDTSSATLAGNAQTKRKEEDRVAQEHKEKNEATRRQNAVEQNRDYLEQEEAQIKGQGLQELAAREYAMVMAQGGYKNAKGGWHKLSGEDDARGEVQRRLKGYMHRQIGKDRDGNVLRANPNLGEQGTEDIALKLSLDAQKGVKDQFSLLMGKTNNATVAMQQILMQTQAAVFAISQQLNGINANTGQLERNMHQIQRSMNAGQTNLNIRG